MIALNLHAWRRRHRLEASPTLEFPRGNLKSSLLGKIYLIIVGPGWKLMAPPSQWSLWRSLKQRRLYQRISWIKFCTKTAPHTCRRSENPQWASLCYFNVKFPLHVFFFLSSRNLHFKTIHFNISPRRPFSITIDGWTCIKSAHHWASEAKASSAFFFFLADWPLQCMCEEVGVGWWRK